MKKLASCRSDRAEAMPVGGGAASGRPPASAIVPEKAMLGRYEIEKELGKGAMGIVYLGREPATGRAAAIKTMALSEEFEADELEEVKQRFFREAETAGRLTHPGIVRMHDAGEERGLAYIAMELLNGRDLAPHTKPDNLLPVSTVLSIAARVAEALAYAHRNNVVHRDIKPANIMYEPESDAVKVTDFGIARITDASRTRAGVVLGTPTFMSPEQLAGQKVGGRSDLYSLGAALYQMLCGRPPFQGASMAQLLFKIANEAHADVRAHNPKLPACVAAIVNKALAKNPDERWEDGETMAKALRLCLQSLTQGAPKQAAPAGPPAPATSQSAQ
jgi:serine/threonine-protein kinase